MQMANPHALHARVQKLLNSRAEIESTTALLNTLVTGDMSVVSSPVNESPRRGQSAPIMTLDQNTSLADLRKNLRSTLEKKQLELVESSLDSLRATLDRISSLKVCADHLDTKCTSIQRFLDSTKRETQQVQIEATALAEKKHKVQQELEEVKAFLAKYQLDEQEIQGLYTKSLQDDDMMSFFTIMERVQQVRTDCRALLTTDDVHCTFELLDAIGKYQEVGFERLYQWTTKKCAEVEGEPSTQLHQAITLLKDRPEFYNHCKESLTASRRSLLVRRFIIALTRGGPNGIPRPIEIYAHDPVRYCGDMLAWVHQAIATETEFFRVLFDGDLEFVPSPHMETADYSTSTSIDSSSSQPEHSEINAAESVSSPVSMVGRAFDGVARPLQVRIEQTLSVHHGIVLAYKLVHLLSFYHNKFNVLIGHSGIADILSECRRVAHRAFDQQFQLLVHSVTSSVQDYATNLAATHAAMDVSHRLVELLTVFQSSLVPQEEQEADLTPLFDGILPAVRSMCERTMESFDGIDALVFQINNMSCIRVPLAQFPDAKKWFVSIGDEIEQHMQAVAELLATRVLDRYNVSSLLDKINTFQAENDEVTQGLDGKLITSIMEEYCTALMSLVFPQLDQLTQPELREKGRLLVVTRLAHAYETIYKFVQTHHANEKILLHTPYEVRTVLEMD